MSDEQYIRSARSPRDSARDGARDSDGDRDSAGLDFAAEVRRGAFVMSAQLHVARGETLGVVGPNGAGKSTLLGAIAGTQVVSTGSVAVAGRALADVPPWKRRIGYLEQKPRLFPHLDAADNISFGLRSRGVRRRAARAEAAQWLERMGLPGRDRDRPAAFSGGQQQRIALARALAAAPEVVLLDEPFAALDVTSAVALRELVREELDRLQVPALMVTHDPQDLAVLADRTVALDRGRVVESGVRDPARLGSLSTPAARTELHGVVQADGTVVVEEQSNLAAGTEVILRVVRKPRAVNATRARAAAGQGTDEA